MAETLSEKLGLEPAEEDAVCSPAALEADRGEVVGAVARWLERLCPGCRCPHADDIRRELLAPPSPGESRPRRGRCAGCGEDVEIEPGYDSHIRMEHDPRCDGSCRVGCPIPVACGPVHPELASPGEGREPGGSDG